MNPIPNLAPEYLALLGVLFGAGVTLIGNLLLEKRRSHNEIEQTLFLHRLEIYSKLTELMWPSATVGRGPTSLPQSGLIKAYTSNHALVEWLNRTTNFVTSKRLLIDDQTLEAFSRLNQRVLTDLNQISEMAMPADIDERTRQVGFQSIHDVAELCSDVHNRAWDFFRKTYRVKL